MWLTKNLFSSIGKKGLMAASGFFLALFLLAHLAGNSTSFVGRKAFNSYAAHLHSLGVLIKIFEVFLLTVFLVHVLTGVTLYLENFRSRPKRYAISSKKERRIATLLMPYTGLLTFFFLLIHLANFRFARLQVPIADAVRQLLSRPVFSLFYMLSITGLTFHISHGLWSMFQSLGCNHAKYNAFLEKGAVVVSLLIGSVFLLIPLLALTYDGFLR
jgi:succinate dehydrogenase / fumarate reductase cytochrome b subunit